MGRPPGYVSGHTASVPDHGHRTSRPTSGDIVAWARCDRASFEKLLDDFCIVHVHANNHVFPITYGHYSLHPVVEITLLRKDRARRLAPAGQLTHPLDAPNDPSVVTFPLDSAWL